MYTTEDHSSYLSIKQWREGRFDNKKKLAASSQPSRQIYDWGNLNAEDYYETPWQEKVLNPLDPPLFNKKGSHLWKWKHIHWYTFSKDLRISLRRPCKNLWVGPCSHILWGHWKIDLESCVTIHWNYLSKTCGETFVKIYWEDTVTDTVFGEPSQNILKQPCKTFRADPCQNICWPPCTNISQKLCHNISSRFWESCGETDVRIYWEDIAMIELIFQGQENEARSSNQFNGLNFQKICFCKSPSFFLFSFWTLS